jgi:hypothetical protein
MSRCLRGRLDLCAGSIKDPRPLSEVGKCKSSFALLVAHFVLIPERSTALRTSYVHSMSNDESPAQETIPRCPDGRFTVAEGMTALLDNVAHIARIAAEGGDPARVSRRTFNHAAAQLTRTTTSSSRGTPPP